MAGVTYPRHRTRGQSTYPQNVTIRVTDHAWTDYTFPTETRWTFSNAEDIWDGTGSIHENHPVLHDKLTLKTRRITRVSLTPVPGGATEMIASPFWLPRSPLLYQPTLISYLNNTSYERGGPRWKEFLANAFQSITEQVPTVIDVPNLLKDVITLKGLAKQGWTVCTNLWKLFSKLGGYGGHFANLLTLRKIIKNLSDGFLINEFGVKPLIREVESCLYGLNALLRRFAFLSRTQGSVFTAKYSESIGFNQPDALLDLADNMGLADVGLWLRDSNGTMKYTCVAKIQNNLKNLDGLWAETKMYLSALGGQDIVAFLWDLVPWSFVVDWFYNVGDLANRYARIEPFEGSLDVKSASTSAKKLCTARLTLEGHRLVNGSIDFGELRYSTYDRQPSYDVALNTLLPSSGLTPHQLGILAGLLGQRL